MILCARNKLLLLVFILCGFGELEGLSILSITVTQPTGDVTAVQGLTLTLQCTFETSSTSPTLFWYKQEVNDYPRYMLHRLRSGSETYKPPEFQDERFDTEINQTSFPLKIQKLHVSDSAVYYCAVRPTVTGNSKTLNKNLWSKDNTSWICRLPWTLYLGVGLGRLID
uniref:Ig-like domain-containing protein n=1 Tax=Sphaeramia orbicularis TaxID=375764 RepID=A0A672Y5B8_9TELE